MIRLDTITRTIIATITNNTVTNPINVIVSYSDDTGTTYSGATSASVISSTSPVTICAAPSASIIRNIDSITVFNKDTIFSTIYISFNDNGTLYQLINVTLQLGETLQYTHGRGWETCDINGALKSSLISQYATNLTGTPTLPNGVSAITQTALNNSNLLATTNYVDSAMLSYSVSHTTIYSANINLGSTPVSSGHFVITGNGFTPGSQVHVWQSSVRPNSVLYDSIEMDQIHVAGIVINSNNIHCNWGSLGPIANTYTFNYRF